MDLYKILLIETIYKKLNPNKYQDITDNESIYFDNGYLKQSIIGGKNKKNNNECNYYDDRNNIKSLDDIFEIESIDDKDKGESVFGGKSNNSNNIIILEENDIIDKSDTPKIIIF